MSLFMFEMFDYDFLILWMDLFPWYVYLKQTNFATTIIQQI